MKRSIYRNSRVMRNVEACTCSPAMRKSFAYNPYLCHMQLRNTSIEVNALTASKIRSQDYLEVWVCGWRKQLFYILYLQVFQLFNCLSNKNIHTYVFINCGKNKQ